METISIRQPYPFWIGKGWKTIETRSHNRLRGLVGRRIAIHAAKIMDKAAFFTAKPYLTQEQMNETLLYFGMELVAIDQRPRRNVHPDFGAVVCTAFVTGYRVLTEDDSKNALIKSRRLHGLFLSAIDILPKPVPWIGRVSVFHVPDELILQQ